MDGIIPDLNTNREPVAIIGIGCRFPGGSDLESLWHILWNGVESVADYPGGRFRSLDRTYSGSTKHTGFVTRRGGFLRDLDLFDADFFGISPREAILLDPQHRMLLEMSWEALEDAGIPLNVISGSRTGVFIGQWTSDFEACVNELTTDPQFYSTTGSGRYASSGRLAYHFDLRGPNVTVDTGCSSSLAALHLACQSLRSGETQAALAGAVNVILRPEITLAYGSSGMLSSDGRCKFGDASANGYVRSEGGGVVVLKLLSRAVADCDPVHAVILGSAVTNDGSSSGFLVSPSREGQIAAIRAALRNSNISGAEIDYIEAHGTGTAVGDPIEIEALGTVLAESGRSRPCIIGSAKTNLGHVEAAAGIIGLCKVILSLQHAAIPASLHFREPNPRIPWADLPLMVSTEPQSWPHTGQRRIAGLNSLGITGTNAHAIIENAPMQQSSTNDIGSPWLYVMSARTSLALEQTISRWQSWIQQETSWRSSMADLAYTAAIRRTAHDFRLALVAKDPRDLEERLVAWQADEQDDLTHSGRAAINPPRIVFVFPGQGGQWTGMGLELFEKEPIFRRAILNCDRALIPHTGWSLIKELQSLDNTKAGEIDRVQPVLFGLMIAITELWRSWGVNPDAVVGHSMGEVAAAVVCGALSLEDGALIISKRSGLMRSAAGRGRMMMAALPFAEAKKFVEDYRGRLSIAATNSPSTTILSGDTDAVEAAIERLNSREIFCRAVHVDVASHCAQMDELLPELQYQLAPISPRRAHTPLYSTSTGRVEDGLSLGAQYWACNLREPVLFSDAVQHLIQDGFQAFVEINAHPLLLSGIQEIGAIAGKEIITVPSMRRDKEQVPEILSSLGRLFVSGYPVNFHGLYPIGNCMRLPSYPWQRERYWPEETTPDRAQVGARIPSQQLGGFVESSLNPGTWLCEVALPEHSDGIRRYSHILELVVRAMGEFLDAENIVLEDVSFPTIFNPLSSGQFAAVREHDDRWRFRISAKNGEGWRAYCEGFARQGLLLDSKSTFNLFRTGAGATADSLTACFHAALAGLGSPDEDLCTKILQIDRVEFCARGSDSMSNQAIAITVNDSGALDRGREEDRHCAVRMVGVQFDDRSISDCSQNIYHWTWTEIELKEQRRAQSGAFVIIGDLALSKRLADLLTSRNIECVVASSVESLPDVLKSLASTCRALVWLSSEQSSDPTAAIKQVWEICSLVQSITTAGDGDCPALWLMTIGANELQHDRTDSSFGSRICASQASVWGLARVIAREHPEIRCLTVDFAHEPDAMEFDVWQTLANSEITEDQIAIRATKCYALRLEPRRESYSPEISLDANGSYLITGGFGDLGLVLTEFLIDHGARNIAIVGRNTPGEAALKTLARIEEQRKLKVQKFKADVANFAEVSSVLKQIDSKAPLKGIFHLAGSLHDALISKVTPESLEEVMRPKVHGAWNLHRLTEKARLDYFVMYSSIAAVASQPGQGSYAAANAYMDGLATLRNANGLPATSVQWGPWKEKGMIRKPGAAQSCLAWANSGIGSFSTGMGLDGIRRVLACPSSILFIANIDWTRFAESVGSHVSPAFSTAFERTAKTSQEEAISNAKLGTLTPAERETWLSSRLQRILAQVLKQRSSRIDETARFGSMGVDSLMSVEFARRITESLGVRLPVTSIFNYPTLELLTAEVARRIEWPGGTVLQPSSTGSEGKASQSGASLSTIKDLSDEQALHALLKMAEPK